MELPRTAVKPFEVDVTATLPNGSPATLTGVRFSLCDHGGPTAATVWVSGGYSGGVGSGVLCGPDAATPPVGSLVLSVARAGLWGQPVASGGTTVDPWFIDTIELP